MSREKFEEMVDEGVKAIPEKFLRKLDNVAIVVEAEPAPAQIKKLKIRRGWTLFGLYEGVPQAARGAHYFAVLPDKITIFQKPIEEAADSGEEMELLTAKLGGIKRNSSEANPPSLKLRKGSPRLHLRGKPRSIWRRRIKEIVKNTVWHEIAHHFGMDEGRVRQAEARRKK